MVKAATECVLVTVKTGELVTTLPVSASVHPGSKEKIVRTAAHQAILESLATSLVCSSVPAVTAIEFLAFVNVVLGGLVRLVISLVRFLPGVRTAWSSVCATRRIQKDAIQRYMIQSSRRCMKHTCGLVSVTEFAHRFQIVIYLEFLSSKSYL